MPFNRMQDAVTLATGIDTAMSRRDDIGMDMLRDLLPELREIIDEINAALREVDELLFTGLRDEAITLNDPEFARVAARLNLEDKEAWPDVQAFFEREGITPPPKLDFETLVALESAHAEVEQLGRPLDRMRRLVLERAPVLTRLALLRRIRDADSTKPVWAETIIEHERARLAELPDAVRRALSAKDPDAIAALHAELVDPEWSISVPKDLVKSTRGADLWSRLRDALPVAERAATALEAGLAAAASGLDQSAAAALRQARHEWYEASGAVHECMGGLSECPSVAALARDEGLEARFAGLGARTQPALSWIEQEDVRETAIARQGQALAQLESLLTRLPASAGQEPQWLAGVAHLKRELASQGAISTALEERVAEAVAIVARRPVRRLVVKGAVVAAAAVALIAVLVMVRGCASASRERTVVIKSLERILHEARAHEYGVVPQQVADIANRYSDDETVAELREDIERAVSVEADRRNAVQKALTDHAQQTERALGELEPRKSGEGALEPWPVSVAAAAKAWRTARARGGEPDRRGGGETKSAIGRKRAAEQFAAEEELIEKAREQQASIERQYHRAALREFTKRRDDLAVAIEAKPAPDARRAIREQIDALRAAADAAVPGDTISDSSSLAIPKGQQLELDRLAKQLAELEKEPSTKPPAAPPSPISPDVETEL